MKTLILNRETDQLAFFARAAMEKVTRHNDPVASTWNKIRYDNKRFARECFDLADEMMVEFKKRCAKILKEAR